MFQSVDVFQCGARAKSSAVKISNNHSRELSGVRDEWVLGLSASVSFASLAFCSRPIFRTTEPFLGRAGLRRGYETYSIQLCHMSERINKQVEVDGNRSNASHLRSQSPFDRANTTFCGRHQDSLEMVMN